MYETSFTSGKHCKAEKADNQRGSARRRPAEAYLATAGGFLQPPAPLAVADLGAGGADQHLQVGGGRPGLSGEGASSGLEGVASG